MTPIRKAAPVHLGPAALATMMMLLPWLIAFAVQRIAGLPHEWRADVAWCLWPMLWPLHVAAAFCSFILLTGFLVFWRAVGIRGLWRLGR